MILNCYKFAYLQIKKACWWNSSLKDHFGHNFMKCLTRKIIRVKHRKYNEDPENFTDNLQKT